MLRVAAQNIVRHPLRAGLLGLSVTLAVGVGFAGFVGGWALRDGVATSFSRMGADILVVPAGALVNLTSTLLTVQPTESELDSALRPKSAIFLALAMLLRNALSERRRRGEQ
jgi:putative ABC transport system permease protein